MYYMIYFLISPCWGDFKVIMENLISSIPNVIKFFIRRKGCCNALLSVQELYMAYEFLFGV